MPRPRPLTGTVTKKPAPVFVFSLLAVSLTVFVWLPKLAADTQAAPQDTAQGQQMTGRQPAIDARRQAAEQLRQEKSSGSPKNHASPDSAKGAAVRAERAQLLAERKQQKQASIALAKQIRAACTAQHKTDTKAVELCSRDHLIQKARQRAAKHRQERQQAKAQQ